MKDAKMVPYAPERLTAAEGLARGQVFQAQLERRRSVRSFSTDAVPREMIETAIAAAGTAPSGANLQPWHFVAVSNPDIKARIRAAAEAEERENYGGRMSQSWLDDLAYLGTDAHKPMLEDAPWLIAVFRHATRKGGLKTYYAHESVGIAVGMLLTSLHLQGLAALTHTPSPMKFLAEILGRPANEKAYLLIPVGYPAPGCQVPDLHRKPLGEIASFVE